MLVSIAESGTNRVYSWDGTDWHELFSLNASQPPDVFEDVVVFRSGFSSPGGQSTLWLWDKTAPAPIPWVAQTPRTRSRSQLLMAPPSFEPPARRQSASAKKPRWTLRLDESLGDCGLTFYRSTLYLYADHAILTNVAGVWRILEKDGYHAELICLCDDLPGPLVVPLKFDVRRGKPPLRMLTMKRIPIPWETYPPMLVFADDVLCVAHATVPGIWLISLAELQEAFAAQKPLLQPESDAPPETWPSPMRPPWQTNLPPFYWAYAVARRPDARATTSDPNTMKSARFCSKDLRVSIVKLFGDESRLDINFADDALVGT